MEGDGGWRMPGAVRWPYGGMGAGREIPAREKTLRRKGVVPDVFLWEGALGKPSRLAATLWEGIP